MCIFYEAYQNLTRVTVICKLNENACDIMVHSEIISWALVIDFKLLKIIT